jgi:hypothetical protein
MRGSDLLIILGGIAIAAGLPARFGPVMLMAVAFGDGGPGESTFEPTRSERLTPVMGDRKGERVPPSPLHWDPATWAVGTSEKQPGRRPVPRRKLAPGLGLGRNRAA